jgi:SAM-dependent methyltransferase
MPGAGKIETGLDRLYARRFSAAERAEKTRLWGVLCERFFARYVSAEATVLDLGAGYCDFINQIRAARRIAVDLNPDTVHAAAPGVEVHALPLDRLGEAVEAGSVDLVFASNVFEHLQGPDVLLSVLEAVFRTLRPGGRLLILQPNVRRVGTAFWDFVDHRLPLTEKGMAEALGLVGFRVEECRPGFLPYTTKAKSWLPRWSWLLRLYLALPPAHWVWGKQMFLVAIRPPW